MKLKLDRVRDNKDKEESSIEVYSNKNESRKTYFDRNKLEKK